MRRKSQGTFQPYRRPNRCGGDAEVIGSNELGLFGAGPHLFLNSLAYALALANASSGELPQLVCTTSLKKSKTWHFQVLLPHRFGGNTFVVRGRYVRNKNKHVFVTAGL